MRLSGPGENNRLIIALEIQTVFLFKQKKRARRQAEILRKCQASAAFLPRLQRPGQIFSNSTAIHSAWQPALSGRVMKHPEIARHAGKKSTAISIATGAIEIVPFRQPCLTTS